MVCIGVNQKRRAEGVLYVRNNTASFGNVVSLVNVVFHDSMGQSQRHRRVPPDHDDQGFNWHVQLTLRGKKESGDIPVNFLQDALHIWEQSPVLDAWKPL